MYNTATKNLSGRPYDANYFDTLHPGEMRERNGLQNGVASDEEETEVSEQGKKVLDQIGEALARLGRVKRVNLGVGDKQKFAVTWSKHRRVW